MNKAVDFLQKGGKPKELKNAGFRSDMLKRGAVRMVYDGRYVFARYLSPKQHNRPITFEDLFRLNDVELFDVEAGMSVASRPVAQQVITPTVLDVAASCALAAID